ncbi:hypothetical protein CN553_11935 [Bacillus cereus]|uniref:Uncharacterized protein n=1 Tax=Bacillus cereus TaxID=1396 RepID=A0A9X6YMG1_BACCE|nr:hypothetical protein [Bacillus cereus]EOO44196.1 hypothetical protein ICK_06453 [Bacillus cereus BAG1X2-2]EOP00405.1 hypothetical protein ICO_06361 [Bacillus cereus BAG2O-1]PEN97756.1 hypothetical protein CN553_11935 [Bacillus cereus]
MEYTEVSKGENKKLDESLRSFLDIFEFNKHGVAWEIFDDEGCGVFGLIDLSTGEVLCLGR